MPRVAILSDLHANIHALDAVLREVEEEGVDGIAFGGDLVGYGAFPAEVVARVREVGGVCVCGNHDYFVASLRDQAEALSRSPSTRANPVWAGVLHSVRALDDDALDWLAGLPMRAEIPGAILAHASLHDVEDWPYLESPEDVAPTLRALAGSEHMVGFFGHTHHHRLFFDSRFLGRPVLTPRGRIYLPEDACCAVTVGSVGQPRDLDYRAGYAIWDSDNRLLDRCRTTYDAEAAARAIRDAGLPASSAARLLEGQPNASGEQDEPPHPRGTFTHSGREVGVPVD